MAREKRDAVVFEATPPSEMADYLAENAMPSSDLRILTGPPEDTDQRYSECSLFGHVLADLLGAVPKLLDGQAVGIELDSSIVRLSPDDDADAVAVWFDVMGVPDDVRADKPDLVDRDVFVTELFQFCTEWLAEAREINADLEQCEWFQDAEAARDRAVAALDGAGIQTDLEPERG